MNTANRFAPQACAALAILTMGLSLLLQGCGGGASSATGSAQGKVLAGDDAKPAASVLTNLADHAVASGDIAGTYLLTRLYVRLAPTTTVAQFNAAAKAIGATAITSSEANGPDLIVSVPHQPDVASLQKLAQTLRAQAGIAFAWPGQMPKTSVLPETAPGIAIGAIQVGHLLASRFPQAWNARHAAPQDCLPRSVDVFVFDVFGNVANRPAFLTQMWPNGFVFDTEGTGDGPLGEAAGHGFDVALTLGARFDGTSPTGANPFQDCLQLQQLEVGGFDLIDAIRGKLSTVQGDPDAHVVLTSSVNFPDDAICGANGDEVCSAANIAASVEVIKGALFMRTLEAGAWGAAMRNRHLLDKVLITQAAGNVSIEPHGFLARNYVGFRNASLASPAALATHLDDLQAILTSPGLWKSETPGLPDLTFTSDQAAQVVQELRNWDEDHSIAASNLLIVDSGTDAEAFEDVAQSDFDMLGADVRAVGENVVTSGDNLLDGTSFSTPVVAGLAAYLWNLSPDLYAKPVAATVDLIRKASRTTVKSPTVPVLDAYTAVLMLDSAGGCCTGSVPAPTRLGLLDIDGDGKFTSTDLQKFVTGLKLDDPNAPSIPADPDYGRFDLNGDGFTGGILNTAFSLDAALDGNGQFRIASLGEAIEGYPVTFNEAALSDLQVLCYYAYSSLYTPEGSGQDNPLRRRLLGANRCIGLQLDLALTQDIQAGGTGQVTIKLQQPGDQGQLVPAANVSYTLVTTGGTASPAAGVTDAQGSAAATVRADANATTLSVTAIATAPNGGAPLVQATASARVTSVSDDIDVTVHGTYVSTCSGFVFPGQTPPPAKTTSGPATARFTASGGQAKLATISAPGDAFFASGQTARLFDPVASFQGFIDPGNGFIWATTGSFGAQTLTINVDERGSNCTFVFNGNVSP